MQILIYIMVFLCTAIECHSLYGQANQQNGITRMDIVSLSYDVSTRGAVTFDRLLTWTEKGGAFRGMFTDHPFLDSIDKQLHQLQPVAFDGYTVDHRIACVIIRENGQVDKLGISNLYFTFNGKYYQQNDNLLLLIADRLPENQKEVIYKFVHRQQEVQRQKANGTYKEEIEDWEKEE